MKIDMRKFVAGLLARIPVIGLRGVLLTFKAGDAPESMQFLLRAERSSTLNVDPDDRYRAHETLAGNREFVSEEQRSFRVTLLTSAEPAELEQLFARLTEVMAPQHALSDLQAPLARKRKAAAKRIFDSWITEQLADEVADWGLSLTSELINLSGFHLLRISLQNGEEVVADCYLDGWSGNLGDNRGLTFTQEASPELLASYLLEQLAQYSETFTAPPKSSAASDFSASA